jgi:hypothetical protein
MLLRPEVTFKFRRAISRRINYNLFKLHGNLLSKLAQAVTFLIYIQAVPCLNLGSRYRLS